MIPGLEKFFNVLENSGTGFHEVALLEKVALFLWKEHGHCMEDSEPSLHWSISSIPITTS